MKRSAFLLRHIRHAVSPDRRLFFPHGRAAFLRSLLAWSRDAYASQMVPADGPERFTVLLLSYKRPWNIEAIARSCLRCERVARVIVSNNNPAVRLENFLGLHDPRLDIVTQPRRLPASVMPVVAAEQVKNGDTHFLSIDDDLFLSPVQINALCDRLTADPAVPHGMVGQVMHEGRAPDMHVTGERQVDVLNRAYAFTAAHAARYVAIMQALGRSSAEQQMEMPFGSDIVLSFCGDAAPRIHDLGALLSCPTAALPGIARFKEEGFDAFRSALYNNVSRIARPVTAKP